MDNDKQSPAVLVAKERRQGDTNDVRTLSTGVRARLHPVGASIVTDATGKVKPPKVPSYYNESKGREEENPNDTSYLAALDEVKRAQASAAMDVMVMFGVELVDGMPVNDAWLKQLKLLDKIGTLDLSVYDLDDPIDCEFLYKKYIATGTPDLIAVGRLAGLSPESVAEATSNFPGGEGRVPD